MDAEIKGDGSGFMKSELSHDMSRKLDWLMLILFDFTDFFFEVRNRTEAGVFG